MFWFRLSELGKCRAGHSQRPPCNLSCKSTAIRNATINPVYLTVYLNCRFGRELMLRKERGAIQKGLNLDDLRDVPVFVPSPAFQSVIEQRFRRALEMTAELKRQMEKAGEVLLAALGLANWTPPEPLAYTARASDVFASGRFRCPIFRPAHSALLDLLAVDGRTIADVANPRREKFRPNACAAFDYIEISDIDGAGAATSTRLASEDAPSRAHMACAGGGHYHVHRAPDPPPVAQITPEQEGFVCSSGFVVVTPRDIAPEVLLTYLRLPVICELLDLFRQRQYVSGDHRCRHLQPAAAPYPGRCGRSGDAERDCREGGKGPCGQHVGGGPNAPSRLRLKTGNPPPWPTLTKQRGRSDGPASPRRRLDEPRRNRLHRPLRQSLGRVHAWFRHASAQTQERAMLDWVQGSAETRCDEVFFPLMREDNDAADAVQFQQAVSALQQRLDEIHLEVIRKGVRERVSLRTVCIYPRHLNHERIEHRRHEFSVRKVAGGHIQVRVVSLANGDERFNETQEQYDPAALYARPLPLQIAVRRPKDTASGSSITPATLARWLIYCETEHLFFGSLASNFNARTKSSSAD